MSGCVGADRIDRNHVSDTVFSYYMNVIKNIQEVGLSLAITGSFISNPSKKDFGDIDLLIHVDAPDLQAAKKILMKEFKDNEYILPFDRNGKTCKWYNAGELLSVKFEQLNGSTVQIDNIIALSEEEFNFKREFYNLPAEIQGLYLGLVKVHNWETSQLEEPEWDLSSSSLRLRYPDKSESFKSRNWPDVKCLLGDLGIDTGWDFYRILEDVKRLSPRSVKRIKGLFNKMVSVKKGELNTEKGINKQKFIDLVNAL